VVETSLRVSKSFVIDADAVKVYDFARDFFLKLGYEEQNAVRPTLLVLKRRIVKGSDSSNTEDYRISLRASFSPLGNLRIYSTALVAVRCDYDVKVSGVMAASSGRTVFESEVERLRCHIVKLLHAPIISPSTLKSCATISSEKRKVSSKGIERADIQAKLIQHETEIRIGEDLNLKILIENVGEKALLLTKIENLVPIGFKLVGKPENSLLEDAQLIMKEKRLAPGVKLELEIVLRPSKKGTFDVKPKISFSDEAKHEFCIELEPKTYHVSDKVLPGRIATGYEELDTLLFGGIPENYAVLMTSSSNDEREQIIKKFLTAGAESGQITFYIAVEPGNGKILAEKFQTNFYLFICNPRADLMISSLPNVFKVSGVENLSEIDIALTKSFRLLDASKGGPRRACIEIISDVLLQHHAVITRKWLSRLLPELKSKGFTTLGIVNPNMHPREEVHALMGLFEGEIRISEKETEKGVEKSLRIGKLYNQPYLESDATLKKERVHS
jgi:KaiC/GvpD/RAD55 family RecA-like ATPase